jgi:hypothetical protein
MQKDLSPLELEFLRRNVGIRRASLGQAEFELCLRKVREQFTHADSAKLVALVTDELDRWRVTFTGGKTSMTTEEWQRIFDQSENAARNQLLGDSSTHKRVEELNEKAKSAKRQAEQAAAELTTQWSEFNVLPEEKAKLGEVLKRIAKERAILEREEIENSFKEVYRTSILHPERNIPIVINLVELLTTRELRIPVLDSIEKETRESVEKLKVRNRQLAAKLDQPEHRFSIEGE